MGHVLLCQNVRRDASCAGATRGGWTHLIKLVLCDMDGTLKPFGLDRVSPRSIRAIHELRRAGIEFGPATGREPVDLYDFFGGDDSCYATGIMANGKIVDVDRERVLAKTLDHAALKRLEAFCLGNPEYALVAYVPAPDKGGRPQARVIISGATADEVEAYARRTGITLAEGSEIASIPEGEILTAGFAYMGESEDAMGELRNRLAAAFPEFDFVRPAPTFFDVLPHGWTKASAFEVLLQYLNISRDEVAFFGDSENDVAMLRAVGASFAVSNGTRVAQGAARYHIGDAADDSVAKVMEAIARSGGELTIPEDALPR